MIVRALIWIDSPAALHDASLPCLNMWHSSFLCADTPQVHTVRDMFTRQLLQFPGLTAPKALEIAARFPTALRYLFSLLLKAGC